MQYIIYIQYMPSGVLAGGAGGLWPPPKIFRGRQKLEKGAKNCILMTQERRLSAEIQNLEKPKNSSTLLGVFASRKGVTKTARAL